MAVHRQKYGVTTPGGGMDIFHFETDDRVVLLTDEGITLYDKLKLLSAERTFTLAGDVTGTVVHTNTGNVIVDTEVTDDSHRHTGSTVEAGVGDRVVVTAENKTITVSEVTTAELSRLSGITGNVQSQLNSKASTTHNHDEVYLKQGLLGANGGIVPLGANGKISSQYLPGYVDDWVEGILNGPTSFTVEGEDEPCVPESGKGYVDISTNLLYRWSGSAFTPVGEGVALGETSETAYRGDRGAAAYNHSQSPHARSDATKTEKSETNGNVVIDGTETVIYTHPSITVTLSTDKQTLTSGGTFTAISAISVNASGHVTGKTTKTFTMPNVVNVQSGTTEPTNQVAGDFWLQTLT